MRGRVLLPLALSSLIGLGSLVYVVADHLLAPTVPGVSIPGAAAPDAVVPAQGRSAFIDSGRTTAYAPVTLSDARLWLTYAGECYISVAGLPGRLPVLRGYVTVPGEWCQGVASPATGLR